MDCCGGGGGGAPSAAIFVVDAAGAPRVAIRPAKASRKPRSGRDNATETRSASCRNALGGRNGSPTVSAVDCGPTHLTETAEEEGTARGWRPAAPPAAPEGGGSVETGRGGGLREGRAGFLSTGVSEEEDGDHPAVPAPAEGDGDRPRLGLQVRGGGEGGRAFSARHRCTSRGGEGSAVPAEPQQALPGQQPAGSQTPQHPDAQPAPEIQGRPQQRHQPQPNCG